ncbi:hypothetical protein [Kamptonema formosum]|nr:hypothetical protein [Oscillatoria sp. PCC 10802]
MTAARSLDCLNLEEQKPALKSKIIASMYRLMGYVAERETV